MPSFTVSNSNKLPSVKLLGAEYVSNVDQFAHIHKIQFVLFSNVMTAYKRFNEKEEISHVDISPP
jgi:hypothetical protein